MNSRPATTPIRDSIPEVSTTGLKKGSLNKDTSKTDLNISSRNKKLLLIKCLPRPDFEGGMMFWCPWCKRWHLHGRGEGSRGAHCSERNTPFKETDYIIKMIPLAELREIRDAINNWLRFAPEKRRAYQK